jgi:hypothetical protein
MKKLLASVLSLCLVAGLFFTSSTTLFAAEMINPYQMVEGEALDIRVANSSVGYYSAFKDRVSGMLHSNGCFGYSNVDFGTGASSITAQVYGYANATLSIRVDSPDSEPVGSVYIPRRGNFAERVINFNKPISGVHSLYFSVGPMSGSFSFVCVDKWIAEKAPLPDLTLDYSINNWGSGYNVDFNVVNNTDKNINGWSLKIKKSDCPINYGWNVNIKEDGDYYVITPLDWNSIVPVNGSVSFGINGSGDLSEKIEHVFEDPIPVEASELAVDYDIQSWDDGYNVNFTLTNNSDNQLNGWTIKLNKSDVNITSSWSVNVEEDGDYYVLTPADWNTILGPHGSTTFGIQGSGEIGDAIGYVIE